MDICYHCTPCTITLWSNLVTMCITLYRRDLPKQNGAPLKAATKNHFVCRKALYVLAFLLTSLLEGLKLNGTCIIQLQLYANLTHIWTSVCPLQLTFPKHTGYVIFFMQERKKKKKQQNNDIQALILHIDTFIIRHHNWALFEAL